MGRDILVCFWKLRGYSACEAGISYCKEQTLKLYRYVSVRVCHMIKIRKL